MIDRRHFIGKVTHGDADGLIIAKASDINAHRTARLAHSKTVMLAS